MSLLNNGTLLEDFSKPEADSLSNVDSFCCDYPCYYPQNFPCSPGCSLRIVFIPCFGQPCPRGYAPVEVCIPTYPSVWPCPPGYRRIRGCLPIRPGAPCPPGYRPIRACVRNQFQSQCWPC